MADRTFNLANILTGMDRVRQWFHLDEKIDGEHLFWPFYADLQSHPSLVSLTEIMACRYFGV